MGFLSKFKELFNKNIECGDELDNHILCFLKKKKYIYLGKNIIVRDNSVCVIVYKGRVCDVILPGKYKITHDIIPECYGRAKIERKEGKGIKVKKIRVNLYFINTSEFKDFDFISDNPFVIKSRELGKIKGCLGGRCVVRVIDPALLVKCLISKYRRVNTNSSTDMIAKIVGNKINKKFEKSKVPFDMLVTNQQQVNAILNSDLEDAFDKQGLFVKNVSLKTIDIVKNHKKKVNDYIATHKRMVTPTNLSRNMWSVSHGVPVILNTDGVKVCRYCGCNNNISDRICRSCKKILD